MENQSMNERIQIIGYNQTDALSKGESNNSKSISISNLKQNLESFTNKLDDVFSGIASNINEFKLDEIELRIEISTSGELRLVGKVAAGATGGISLRYKRDSHE